MKHNMYKKTRRNIKKSLKRAGIYDTRMKKTHKKEFTNNAIDEIEMNIKIAKLLFKAILFIVISAILVFVFLFIKDKISYLISFNKFKNEFNEKLTKYGVNNSEVIYSKKVEYDNCSYDVTITDNAFHKFSNKDKINIIIKLKNTETTKGYFCYATDVIIIDKNDEYRESLSYLLKNNKEIYNYADQFK